METFDAIIIGAGGVGSAAAYHAARHGYKTLLLEQFEIDHQNGSSYGASRIIRYAYDYPIYVEMMKIAFPLWFAFQEEAGEPLYVQTGGIDFGMPDEPSMQDFIYSLSITGIPFQLLTSAEARESFPQFRFDDGMQILYQADAGALKASKCVRAHIRLAQQHGALVHDSTPVTGITVHADTVEVQTPAETYAAAKLILAPGAWGKQLFAAAGLDLPLRVVRTQEQYFRAEPAADYEPGRFPVFIAHTPNRAGLFPYGLPSVDGSGLKVGIHGGPPVDDPDHFDRAPLGTLVDDARAFMRHHLPGGDAGLIYARTCLYTMTPDEHFVIDLHPEHPHVAISASCSGHAFKFTHLIGKMLCDLAFEGTTPHDIHMFRASRFSATNT